MNDQIEQLKSVFAKQKAAFRRNPYPSLSEREELLSAGAAMMIDNRKRIHEAVHQDFGQHSSIQTDFCEVFPVAGRFEFVKSQLATWMAAAPRDADPALYADTKAYLLPQPKGVVGNMSPWNFPIEICFGPLTEMLAAGNRVILKPSDMAPACSQLVEDMVKATFDEEFVAVAYGGLELSKAFPKLPWDHLLYTGNPEIGRYVAGEAAKNLTPVTLELGGKCPAIFTPEAVTRENISNLLQVKMLKNGQMCISPDHAIVPREKLSEFVDLARTWAKAEAADYVSSGDAAAIINDRHYDRLQNDLSNAQKGGAEVIQLTDDGNAGRRLMALYLVVNPPADCELMQNEIFGPILPVVIHDGIDNAIEQVQDRGERPLGLYLFSDDRDIQNQVISLTQSGGVTINGAAFQGGMANMGFGGSGNSGYGMHHGIEGFREFSNLRGIVEFDKQAIAHIITPPYGDAAEGLIASIVGEE